MGVCVWVGVVGGIICGGLMLKKAIANINVAIHIRISPNPKIMMSIAPIKSINPVVENNPTFVLAERRISDRL